MVPVTDGIGDGGSEGALAGALLAHEAGDGRIEKIERIGAPGDRIRRDGHRATLGETQAEPVHGTMGNAPGKAEPVHGTMSRPRLGIDGVSPRVERGVAG